MVREESVRSRRPSGELELIMAKLKRLDLGAVDYVSIRDQLPMAFWRC